MSKSQYEFELVMQKVTSGNYEDAVRNTLPYATSGDSYAQCMMGFLCQMGLGMPRDIAEAERWLLKAAEQDNPLAWNNLGTFYLTECCDEQRMQENRQKAWRCYVRAKELGFNCGYPYPPPTA